MPSSFMESVVIKYINLILRVYLLDKQNIAANTYTTSDNAIII